jgi:hypothetical protein
MTRKAHHSIHDRAPGDGLRHGPTAMALLHAADWEMDHLARAAHKPTAVPPGGDVETSYLRAAA